MKHKIIFYSVIFPILILGGFFLLPNSVSADHLGTGGEEVFVDLGGGTGTEYSFRFGCRVGGATKDCERSFFFSNTLGQVYRANYVNFQNDNPTPVVNWCINNTGSMSNGFCGTVQDSFSGNVDARSLSIGDPDNDPNQYRYLVIHIRVQGQLTNDNDFQGDFTMHRRWAEIKSFTTSTPNLNSGSRARLSWNAEWTTPNYERIITMVRPNGTSTSWNGRDHGVTEDATDWEVPENLTQAGTYNFHLEVGGPSEDNGFKRKTITDVTVTVTVAPTGTIRSTINGPNTTFANGSHTGCTKSSTQPCDVILDYTTTNATAGHIKRNSTLWRNIDQTVLPAGTQTDTNPAPRTYTYALYGGNTSTPEKELASVTVTINAEGVTPPPPPPPGSHLLTVSMNPSNTGSGSVTAIGIRCGSAGTDCSESYPAGTDVGLTATPDAGSEFGGWSGNCGPICRMDADKSVVATFNKTTTPVFNLTVTVNGTHSGSATSSPAGINCSLNSTCSASFNQGTNVTLTASPGPGTNKWSWSGTGVFCGSNVTTCGVSMNDHRNVTLTFGSDVPPGGSLYVNSYEAGTNKDIVADFHVFIRSPQQDIFNGSTAHWSSAVANNTYGLEVFPPAASSAYQWPPTFDQGGDRTVNNNTQGWNMYWSFKGVTADIKANGSDGPITVAYNTTAAITWSSTNANSCTAGGTLNSWKGPISTSGGPSNTLPLTSSQSLTITCTAANGTTAFDSVQINLEGTTPPPPPPPPPAGTIIFDVKYTQPKGTLLITCNNPPGGSWDISGIGRRNGPTSSDQVAPNQYTITFNSVNGYNTPASQTVSVNKNSTTSVSCTYTKIEEPKGTLSVTCNNPPGGSWDISGVGRRNGPSSSDVVPVGTYTVTFNPVNGYNTPAPQTTIVDKNDFDSLSCTYTIRTLNSPTNLTLNNSVCGQISLAWNYSSNGVEDGFKIARSSDGNNYGNIQTLNKNTRNYTDTPPQTNQRYYYQVKAYANSPFYREAGSNIADALNLTCTANLGNSSMTLRSVNNQPYTASATLKDADTLTFEITINNSGNANAQINYVDDTLSVNLVNPRNLQLTGGGSNGGISGSAPSIRLNVSGSKPPGGSNWTVRFDTTLSSTTKDQLEQLSNTAAINYTDPTGTYNKTVRFGPILFKTGKGRIPSFREVAP